MTISKFAKKLSIIVAGTTFNSLSGTTKQLLSCLLLSVAATSALTISAQAGTFYVSTGSKEVGEIDDSTGVYTKLVSTPEFTDIALSPEEQLFGITFKQLYSVDLTSQSYQYVGKLGSSLNALGFDNNDNLYAAGKKKFYSIDTSSGKASKISSISGFNSSGDIVFDAKRDLFWATSSTSSGDSLWSITPEGEGTKVGDIGFKAVYGLAFDESGTLLGYTADQKQLELNLKTGAGTAVQEISGLDSQNIWGAASKPDATAKLSPLADAPEPSVLMGLFAIGFGATALKRNQQKEV